MTFRENPSDSNSFYVNLCSRLEVEAVVPFGCTQRVQ